MQPGEFVLRASVQRRAVEDVLTGSGYAQDGTDFAGFSRPLVLDVRSYGAVGDGLTDDAAAIQRAVDAASQGAVILFPATTTWYKVGSTIQVNTKDLVFQGRSFSAATIKYTGTGPCIQLDVDDGNPYDTGSYNGQGAGFTLRDFMLQYTGTTTPLLNGSTGANYGVGTYGIRDWRGGSIRFDRVRITGFEYGFWGIQSDINRWEHVTASSNKVAFYLGPRSDQLTASHLWTFHNDTVWHLDGCADASVYRWITDTDGSNSTPPAKVTAWSSTRTSKGHKFLHPWLENLTGGTSTLLVESFFEASVGDTNRSGTLTVERPTIAVNFYNTAGLQRTKYVVKSDNCDGVEIISPTGAGSANYAVNIQALFSIVNTSGAARPPILKFSDASYPVVSAGTSQVVRLVENYSSAAVYCTITPQSRGVSGGSSGENAHYHINVAGGTNNNVLIGATMLTRKQFTSSVPPFDLNNTQQGDLAWYQFPDSGTPLFWWARVASINGNGTWVPFILPGVSSDRGAGTTVSLVCGVDALTQRWNTPLTADITVTLSDVKNGIGGVNAGSLLGWRVRIVRQAGATGAFNLIVKDGAGTTLKTLTAASTWAEVEHDGTHAILTATGSL